MKWLLAVALLLPALDPTGPTLDPGLTPGQGWGKGGLTRIAAASDLRFALDELVAAYRGRNPSARVEVTYGSSGTFHAQIMQGAPFDLFLSADIAYPRELIAKGRADAATLFTYAIGHIVLWAPSSSPLDLRQGMNVLLDPRVRHIAITNPATAPYGRAAVAAMRAAGVSAQVEGKLVLGENISQAAQFVESGAADVGLIARSLAFAPQLRGKGAYWDVPPPTYPAIEQAGVIVSTAADRAAAARFAAFMRSAGARALLTRYGFAMPAAAQ